MIKAQDGSHRLAGMVILEVPLKAFQAVTWIGKKVGSSKFEEMNNDANDFAAKLSQMKAFIKGSQSQSQAQGAAIAKDKSTNAATKQKLGQTTATLTKTEQGFTQGKARVDGAVAKRGANAAQADAQSTKAGADGKNAESKYADMSQKLTSWAKQHQQARLEAKELAHKRDAAKKEAGKPAGAKKEPVAGEPRGEDKKPTVAGEPRGVQPAPVVASE